MSKSLEEALEEFRLVSNRKKCEFLAFFPNGFVSQKEVAELAVFTSHQPTTSHHLKKYKDYFEFDSEDHFRYFNLNEDGVKLQKAARYILLTNYELQKKFSTDLDYTCIFPEKANPQHMYNALKAIYEDGIRTHNSFPGGNPTLTTRISLDKLEEYGVIKRHYELREAGSRRVRQRVIETTELGEFFYTRLFKSVIEFFQTGKGITTIAIADYFHKGKPTEVPRAPHPSLVAKIGRNWEVELRAYRRAKSS